MTCSNNLLILSFFLNFFQNCQSICLFCTCCNDFLGVFHCLLLLFGFNLLGFFDAFVFLFDNSLLLQEHCHESYDFVSWCAFNSLILFFNSEFREATKTQIYVALICQMVSKFPCRPLRGKIY